MKRAKYIFNKVLGDNYRITCISTVSRLPKKKIIEISAKERELLEFDKKYLEKIKKGNNKAIKHLLLFEHPIYQ